MLSYTALSMGVIAQFRRRNVKKTMAITVPSIKPDVSLREELSRRLKELRQNKFGDLSPEDVVKKYKPGIAARTIRKSETKSSNPRIETLDKLARIYGVTLADLFAFTSMHEEGVLIADLRALVGQDAEVRRAFRTVLSRIRLR